MSDTIAIRGIRGHGRHGHLPDEREHLQPIEVDVELSVDVAPAAQADDLVYSVDYRLIAREVRRVIEEESFLLLETLAEAVAARVLKLGGTKVKVRVGKPVVALLLGAREVVVEVERDA